MSKIQNTIEIWNKIKELRMRNSNKFSQEEIAKLLWINRVALSNIESWERNIKEDELRKICEIFEVPESYFDIKEKKDFKELDKNDPYYSFKRVLLYVLQKCWLNPNVGKTVIYKLMYFIEFNHYEKFWDSLLWVDFIKWPKWPVPKDRDIIFEQMLKDNQIKMYVDNFKWYEQYKIIPLIQADLWEMSYNKIQIIEEVIERLSNMTATQISKYSHWDIPYKATKEMWDIISKWKVFYRTPEYSVANSDDGN